jgi:hypothetical protein
VGAIVTLYVEELKAAMRGRFAWLGVAIVLLAIGGLATVSTQDGSLDYGIIAYGVVPLAFVPFAAGAIAGPRANRFVESVFTAPVERRDWLIAKILVLLTFAAAYYLALIPMLLVYTRHIGLPFIMRKFLVWTPGVMIASIAVGTLIGVLFIGRSIAAPTAAGMGVLLAYGGLIPLQETMVARGDGATRSGHIALASPAVLLKNALGFTLAVGSIPATTFLTWISLGFIVIGALVLAAWVFLRAQGVETWETSRGQRWLIALAIAAIIVVPVVLADTDYDATAPAPNLAPTLRGIFTRGSGSLALVPSGRQLPARWSPLLDREAPLGTDERTRQDMLLLLPVDAAQSVADLHVQIGGDNGLQVTTELAPQLEAHAYSNDAGPAAADGHRITNGWIVRVPVTLMPGKPWDIGGNRYPVNVAATYRVAPGTETRTFNARAAVVAQVSSAIYEMSVASSVLPLICLVAALTRWRRTR